MEKLTLRGPDGTAYIKSSVTRHEAADRRAAIEEILGPDYDLDRLRALMEADRDGLVRIARRPPLESECCGNCAHFQRITGTGRGDCAVREYIKYNRGQEMRERGKFTPSQSRKACRQFQRRRADADEGRTAGDRAAAAGGDGPAVRRPPGEGGSGAAGPVQGESEAGT